jgi:hypothetical protein
VFLEVRALLVLLEALVLLLQTWFTATQTHLSQTQTQETMSTTDTPLTIQIDMDIKFVALTTTTLHIITLEPIMEHHISQPKENLVQHMFPQITTVALIPLLLTIQIRIAIMVVITTPHITMDLTVEFITGMDTGGMRITK